MISTIIVFVLILGVLVFVHELGHFASSIFFKVGVEEFGFGYPPRMFGIKKGKTIYSLNWLPLGGFCKIKGIVGGDQAGEEKKENKKDSDNFINKPIWQRFIILFSGVLMNFILTIILFSIGYCIGLPGSVEDAPINAHIKNQAVIIMETVADSPAAKAGLLAGDQILKIDNQAITTTNSFKENISLAKNNIVTLNVKRNNEIFNKQVPLEKFAEIDQPGIGVYLTETGIIKLPWYSAIYQGLKHTLWLTKMIFKALWDIIYGLFAVHKVTVDLTGPVGIVVLTSEVTQMGFIYILQFTALLSINLAIFNLLPLPALDGGRLLFLLIEKLRGKPANEKIEALVHNIGFSLLIFLVIIITYRDFGKYNIIQNIKNLFN